MTYVVTERAETDGVRYGIAAVQDGKTQERIDDAAPTLDEVLGLAAMLQQCAVPLEHFRAVVQDYVAERDA